jgi:hypothetical protein
MNLRTLALAAAALVLTGCASMAVRTEKDPAMDPKIPRSFAWMMEQDLGRAGGRADRENTYAAIAAAVEDGLAKKGWTLEQDPGKADCVLAFQVDLEKTVSVASFREYSTNPWTWERFSGATRDTDVRVTTYDTGTLILDFVHPTDRKLLWRGSARAVVDLAVNREEKVRLAVEAVGKILDKFR